MLSQPGERWMDSLSTESTLSGDTVSLSSKAYGTSYRLYCGSSNSTVRVRVSVAQTRKFTVADDLSRTQNDIRL